MLSGTVEMTTDTEAENALWRALEERRENLRAEELWTGAHRAAAP